MTSPLFFYLKQPSCSDNPLLLVFPHSAYLPLTRSSNITHVNIEGGRVSGATQPGSIIVTSPSSTSKQPVDTTSKNADRLGSNEDKKVLTRKGPGKDIDDKEDDDGTKLGGTIDSEEGSEKKKKKESFWAAVARSLAVTFAFFFKRPIRLFRPVKISTWTALQALANEQGKPVSIKFARKVIKQEGWRFFPRHVLPPFLVNTTIGLALFTTYTVTTSILSSITFTSDNNSSTISYAALHPTLVPFLAGSAAGAVQSLISAPLDNVRMLLMKISSASSAGGSSKVVYTGWWDLFRSVFLPKDLATTSGERKISSTKSPHHHRVHHRVFHRFQTIKTSPAYSLFSFTLIKDALGFGVFFWTFEIARENAKVVGQWVDEGWSWIGPELGKGVRWIGGWRDGAGELDKNVQDSESEDRYNEDEFHILPTAAKGRSWPGTFAQSMVIIIGGGLAGYAFAWVSTPFDRAREAVWRARRDWSKSKMAEGEGQQKEMDQDIEEDVLKKVEPTLFSEPPALSSLTPPPTINVLRRVLAREGLSYFFRPPSLAEVTSGSAMEPTSQERLLEHPHFRPHPHPTLAPHSSSQSPRHPIVQDPTTPRPPRIDLIRTKTRQQLGFSKAKPAPSKTKPLLPQLSSSTGTKGKESNSTASGSKRTGAGLVTKPRKGPRPKLLSMIPPYAIGFLVYAIYSGDLNSLLLTLLATVKSLVL